MSINITLTRWASPWNNSEQLPDGVVLYSYNYVEKEIPRYVNYDMIDLWKEEPVFKTKLSSFNIFKTKIPFIGQLLKVYLDGNIIQKSVIDNKSFTVSDEYEDGYLYVSYGIPYNINDRIAEYISDNISIQKKAGPLTWTIITEMRNALNKLEMFLGLSQTLWTGGTKNNTKGYADNIMAFVTPISLIHILELREAYANIARKVWVFTEGKLEMRSTFIEVEESNILTCNIIEELRTRINELENSIIRHLS